MTLSEYLPEVAERIEKVTDGAVTARELRPDLAAIFGVSAPVTPAEEEEGDVMTGGLNADGKELGAR